MTIFHSMIVDVEIKFSVVMTERDSQQITWALTDRARAQNICSQWQTVTRRARPSATMYYCKNLYISGWHWRHHRVADITLFSAPQSKNWRNRKCFTPFYTSGKQQPEHKRKPNTNFTDWHWNVTETHRTYCLYTYFVK